MDCISTRVEGGIGWLILDRPEKLNAFSEQMLDEFSTALAAHVADSEVGCVCVCGEGRAFSVGYDVERGGWHYGSDPRPFDDWKRLRGHLERWLEVWRCPKPVVASVHGYCMGGATQLAVFCDLTLVSQDAVIGWPSLPLGGGLLSPVSCWLVGPKKAKELSFIAGSRMSGDEAVAWGWANRAVPDDELAAVTRRTCEQIAKTPSDLLAVKKAALNRILDLQGFSEMIMAGAEFDAIAHGSAGFEASRDKVEELGLKGAIAWFQNSGEGVAP